MRTLRTVAHYFLVLGVFLGLAMAFSVLFTWARIALSPYVTGAIFGGEVMLDWLTTIRMLRARIGIREANPIHALAIAKVGYVGDFVVLIAMLAVIFVFVWGGLPSTYQLGVCCAYTLVYVNNGLIYSRRLGAKHRAEQYANLALRSATERD